MADNYLVIPEGTLATGSSLSPDTIYKVKGGSPIANAPVPATMSFVNGTLYTETTALVTGSKWTASAAAIALLNTMADERKFLSSLSVLFIAIAPSAGQQAHQMILRTDTIARSGDNITAIAFTVLLG